MAECIVEVEPDEDDYDYTEEDAVCWYCHGEGFGVIGLDFPCDDPLWETPGTAKRCPCCSGSGKARDCTFW